MAIMRFKCLAITLENKYQEKQRDCLIPYSGEFSMAFFESFSSVHPECSL